MDGRAQQDDDGRDKPRKLYFESDRRRKTTIRDALLFFIREFPRTIKMPLLPWG